MNAESNERAECSHPTVTFGLIRESTVPSNSYDERFDVKFAELLANRPIDAPRGWIGRAPGQPIVRLGQGEPCDSEVTCFADPPVNDRRSLAMWIRYEFRWETLRSESQPTPTTYVAEQKQRLIDNILCWLRQSGELRWPEWMSNPPASVSDRLDSWLHWLEAPTSNPNCTETSDLCSTASAQCASDTIDRREQETPVRSFRGLWLDEVHRIVRRQGYDKEVYLASPLKRAILKKLIDGGDVPSHRDRLSKIWSDQHRQNPPSDA